MENLEMRFGNNSNEQPRFIVPDLEVSESFSRSGGKGGQNVNKLSTKVEVRWNVNNTQAFTADERERIKLVLGNRITKEGDLIVVAQEERTQSLNRQRAFERLNNLVAGALTPEKKRVPTKPTRASKERRLEKKQRLKEKKSVRRFADYN